MAAALQGAGRRPVCQRGPGLQRAAPLGVRRPQWPLNFRKIVSAAAVPVEGALTRETPAGVHGNTCRPPPLAGLDDLSIASTIAGAYWVGLVKSSLPWSRARQSRLGERRGAASDAPVRGGSQASPACMMLRLPAVTAMTVSSFLPPNII